MKGIERYLEQAATLASEGDHLGATRLVDQAHKLLELERAARFKAIIDKLEQKDDEGGS